MSRNYSLGSSGSKGGTGNSPKDAQLGSKIIHIGTVQDWDDPYGAGRIKVLIESTDKYLAESGKKLQKKDLFICKPFLPLHLNIVPKPQEQVKVIFYNLDDVNGIDREYIGPIIAQKQDLKDGSLYPSGLFPAGPGLPFKTSIDKIPGLQDSIMPVYPKKDEIAIQGRNNSDIIFKNSEILIRVAKFSPDKPDVKNKKNPAYLQLRTINPSSLGDVKTVPNFSNLSFFNQESINNSKETRTDINAVANKIFLIGRDDNSSIVKPEISEEEQVNLEQSLHPLVYGDILKDFINKLFNWVKTHTHPYHNVQQNPAIPSYIELQNWMLTELPKLNSSNIFAGGDILNNSSNILSKIDKNIITNDPAIVRGDELKQPFYNIKAKKLSNNGISEVSFMIENIIDASLVTELKGTDNNLVGAYGVLMNNFLNFINENKIQQYQFVKIPTLNEIPEF